MSIKRFFGRRDNLLDFAVSLSLILDFISIQKITEKMKFSINYLFSKWEWVGSVLNGKP